MLSCDFSLPFTTDFNGAELLPDKKTRRYCKGYEKLAVLVRPDRVNAELAKPYEGRLGASTAAAFKIPTLRNVELTGPYMHNGSLGALTDVLDFYDRLMDATSETLDGGDATAQLALDPLLKKLNVEPDEFTAIEAFLDALNDDSYDRSVPERVPSGLPVPGSTLPSSILRR